ncbi:MAG: hypothetical protein GX275_05090 [Clostridiales bacterium]|nr:hypothetical protein [Clostridiales bacterium]
MKYILFLSLVGIIIFLIFYNNKKLAIIKHQLMLSNSQNSNLKSKLSNYYTISKIKIFYLTPTNRYGIINSNTNILLSPIKNSIVLNKSSIKMEVYVIDMAKINNEYWYYVATPSDDNINSRGWVNKNDFTVFYSNSKSVMKN